MKSFLFSIITFFIAGKVYSCECPHTTLSMGECNKYELIFRGKIISVKECKDKLGEAVFSIEELYKGIATQNFKVLFDCKDACAQAMRTGDEWIIYTNYKQINNAMLDWCSRSRRFFAVEKQDFYTVNYGNDYDDELAFLRDNLGNHRFIKESKTASENRNIRPSANQMIISLLVSLAAVLLFYWLFNKYFRF